MSEHRAHVPGETGAGNIVRSGLQPRILLLVVVIVVTLPILVEFVSAFSATLALNDMGTMAAELAAVGATPAVIEARIDAVRRSVDGRQVTCTLSYARWDEAQDDWGKWRLLGVGAGTNDAMPGDRIMVNLTYRHRLIFGSLVAPLFRARDGVMVLQTARYAGRE